MSDKQLVCLMDESCLLSCSQVRVSEVGFAFALPTLRYYADL